MPNRLSDMPRFISWSESYDTPLSEDDYITECVSPIQSVAVASLLFPQFVSVKGGVFLAHRFTIENFNEWWNHFEGDIQQIEKMINHVHLWDLFPTATGSEGTESAELTALGEWMVMSWAIAVESAYPGRLFSVTLDDDYGPTVTLHSR